MSRHIRLVNRLCFYGKDNLIYDSVAILEGSGVFYCCINRINRDVLSTKRIALPNACIANMVRYCRLGNGGGFYGELNRSHNFTTFFECCGIFNCRINCINRDVFRAKSITFPYPSVSCVNRNCRCIYRVGFYCEHDFLYYSITILEGRRILNDLPLCVKVDISCRAFNYFRYLILKGRLSIPTEESVSSFCCIFKFDWQCFHIVSRRICVVCTCHIMVRYRVIDFAINSINHNIFSPKSIALPHARISLMRRNCRRGDGVGFHGELNRIDNSITIFERSSVFNHSINRINRDIFCAESIALPYTRVSCMSRNCRRGYRVGFYGKLNRTDNSFTVFKRSGIFNSSINRINRDVLCAESITFPYTCISCMRRNSRRGDGVGFYGELDLIDNGIAVFERSGIFDSFPFRIKINITRCTNRYFRYLIFKGCFGVPSKEIIIVLACIRKRERQIFHIITVRIRIS